MGYGREVRHGCEEEAKKLYAGVQCGGRAEVEAQLDLLRRVAHLLGDRCGRLPLRLRVLRSTSFAGPRTACFLGPTRGPGSIFGFVGTFLPVATRLYDPSNFASLAESLGRLGIL